MLDKAEVSVIFLLSVLLAASYYPAVVNAGASEEPTICKQAGSKVSSSEVSTLKSATNAVNVSWIIIISIEI